MIKEYTRVKTKVEKEGYPIGTVGVVVHLYSEGPACEVELWDENEYPQDVVTYSLFEIEEIKNYDK